MAHIHSGGDRLEKLKLNKRRLSIVLGITFVFAIVEIFGGLISNSLALLSDAGHMFIDAAAIGLSLVAVILSMRPPSLANTFSLVRMEIVAAFVNGITLMVIAFYIFYEAIKRIDDPPEINAEVMLSVAVVGFISMVVSAYLLWGGSHDNMNIKGALLHILGDLLGSVGTVAAGAIILVTGWTGVDTIISIIIGLLIIYSSWGLIRDSLHVLMEGTPKEADVEKIMESIKSISGVENIHDFHIWSLTTGIPLLTAHVAVCDKEAGTVILEEITSMLERDYNLKHVTIQIEDALSGNCKVNC